MTLRYVHTALLRINTLILASVLTMTASMQAMDQSEREKRFNLMMAASMQTMSQKEQEKRFQQAAVTKKNDDKIKVAGASKDLDYESQNIITLEAPSK